MSIESGIYTILEAVPAIATAVGTRIYPVVLPQGSALPAITYSLASAERFPTHNGPSGCPATRYQITYWAETHAAAIAGSVLVRKALDGVIGAWGDTTVGQCDLVNERDVFSVIPETSVLNAFGRQLDFLVMFEEAIT